MAQRYVFLQHEKTFYAFLTEKKRGGLRLSAVIASHGFGCSAL
jgi:hypothetical protein